VIIKIVITIIAPTITADMTIAVPPSDVNSVVVAASVVTTVDAATVNRSTKMSLYC